MLEHILKYVWIHYICMYRCLRFVFLFRLAYRKWLWYFSVFSRMLNQVPESARWALAQAADGCKSVSSPGGGSGGGSGRALWDDGKRASGDSRALDVAMHSVSCDEGGRSGGRGRGRPRSTRPRRAPPGVFLHVFFLQTLFIYFSHMFSIFGRFGFPVGSHFRYISLTFYILFFSIEFISILCWFSMMF